MALSYTSQQQTILNSKHLIIKWLVETSGLYLSLGDCTYDSQSYTGKIQKKDFTRLLLNRAKSEYNIQAPNSFKIIIGNKGSTLGKTDFQTAGVYNLLTVRLVISDGTNEDQFGVWTFRIKEVDPVHQRLHISCEDYLQPFLKKPFPGTKLVAALALSDDQAASEGVYNLCVPLPFGTAFIPLQSVWITDQRYYVLGPAGPTYNITKIQSPHDAPGEPTTYLATDYTFQQSNQTIDGESYRCVQFMIDNPSNDGSTYYNGLWRPNGRYLPPLVEFTRSDLSSMTDFPDVIAYALETLGESASMIDTGTGSSFETTKTTLASWGLTFNYGYFLQKNNGEITIASLLNACNCTLVMTDKIELHVLDRTSRATITSADVRRTSSGSTFKVGAIIENSHDSMHVALPLAGKPQDKLISILVPLLDGGDTDNPAADTQDIPFYTNIQHGKRAVQLHGQRKCWPRQKHTFTGKRRLLFLQPDDVITINETRYGGTFVAVVDSIELDVAARPTITILRTAYPLENWTDETPSSETIPADQSQHVFDYNAPRGSSDGYYPANVQNLTAEAWLHGAKFSWSANHADNFDHFSYRIRLSNAAEDVFETWPSWASTEFLKVFRFMTDSEITTYGEDAKVHIEIKAVNASSVDSVLTSSDSITVRGDAIKEMDIEDLAVTNAKIQNLDGDKITVNTVTLSKLDGGLGTLTISSSGLIEIDCAQGVVVNDGADITLISVTGASAANRGMIIFENDSTDILLAGSFDKNCLSIYPSSGNAGNLWIGYDYNEATDKAFTQIFLRAYEYIRLSGYYAAGYTTIIQSLTNATNSVLTFGTAFDSGSNEAQLQIISNATQNIIAVTGDALQPVGGSVNLANPTDKFDYAYIKKLYPENIYAGACDPTTNNSGQVGNISDGWAAMYSYGFYDKSIPGWLDTIDDLAILDAMKAKGVDEKTGHDLLDMQSVPDFLTNREDLKKLVKQQNGDLITDEEIDILIKDDDELGWMLSLNIARFADLVGGGVRQLHGKVKQLEKAILNN